MVKFVKSRFLYGTHICNSAIQLCVAFASFACLCNTSHVQVCIRSISKDDSCNMGAMTVFVVRGRRIVQKIPIVYFYRVIPYLLLFLSFHFR